MRIWVGGSRTWIGSKKIESYLNYIWDRFDGPDVEFILVHGDCPNSPDHIARDHLCRNRKNPWINEPHPANWDLYDRAAGPIRNNEIARSKPDFAIFFWDGTSRGTENSIKLCTQYRISFQVVFS